MATTILQSLSPIPVEVSYDSPILAVALKVYKWNGSAWAQEGAPIPASVMGGNNTYGAIYTPLTTSPYVLELMAYTDNTYTVPLTDYAPSSRSVLVDPILVSQLAQLTSDIADLEAAVADLTTQVTALTGTVTDIEAAAASIEGSASNINTATAGLASFAIPCAIQGTVQNQSLVESG